MKRLGWELEIDHYSPLHSETMLSSSSSSPKLLKNADLCWSKLNSRSFPFHVSQLYLLFLLLNSASSAAYVNVLSSLPSPPPYVLSPLPSPPPYVAYTRESFFNCKDSIKCDTIPFKELSFGRNNGKTSCDLGGRSSSYHESMKLQCNGSLARTIAILGAYYEFLGFSINNESIVIIAETGFSQRFCSRRKENISSTPMFAIIPVQSYCGQPKLNRVTTCSGEFSYVPLMNRSQYYPDEYCWITPIVPIPPLLLKQVGDDFQRLAHRIIAEFTPGRTVNGQVCGNCNDLGGVYVYDLQTNQTRCCCQSSYDRIQFCSSSSRTVSAHITPSTHQVMNSTHGKSNTSTNLLSLEKSNTSKKTRLIASSVTGSIILMIFISIPFIYYTRKISRNASNKQDLIEETIKRYSTQTPKRYTYATLKKITDSFKNKLGQGGFSTVYKGKLPDGRDVAVKLLNESEGNCQDFINEVISITTTSHVNIVAFLGFCYERNKRALIYEYMPKGSLDKYIFRKGPQKNKVELDWKTMYGIIVGVARGLEYLHRGCNTRILHFDIKPHNILLDDEFCPKISDFGLAKQCRGKQSHVSMTGAKGTIGFMAPEVVIRSFGKVSHKSDVYSYGMLVLEMAGERKSPNEEPCSEEYFPDWIYKNLGECEIDRNCKQWGETEEEEEIARKMVVVGLNCIQTLPENRPSMTEVVAMLEGSVDALQIPPKPTFFGHPGAVSSSTSSYLDLPVDNIAECVSARIEVCEGSDHDTRQSLRP